VNSDLENTNRQALRGKRVCVTGRLAAMTHAEFADLVSAFGGTFLKNPVKGSFLLVIGADGWPAQRDGSPSTILRRARKLANYGYPVTFLNEEEFFDSIHLAASANSLRARHTISDLTRILGVSAANVRRWARMGLIQPVESVHRFSYFSYSEVASAKQLCELLAGGASLARIRRGLDQMRSWLPAQRGVLDQVSLLEQDGRLLMRLNGDLIEPNGQKRFDFDDSPKTPTTILQIPARPLPAADNVDELFDRGLAFEDQGKFAEAADAYREAIRLAPDDASLHFNLGNVLYALRALPESLDSFRLSLRCDPNYAEAWNNLAITLSATGDLPGAVSALRRAVELVPDYEDARHNLSRLLSQSSPSALRVIS